MILEFYQNIPLHINPIAFSIGFLHVRWYSLSFILGLMVTFLILNKSILESELKKDAQIFNFEFLILNKNLKFQISNLVIDYLLLSFFAMLIGGRLGYVLFYDLKYFLYNPLTIISPLQDGQFIGFYGMSYHGALILVLIASYLFVRIKKINFFSWADFVSLAIPAGYFFGRIGNFLNGELYGRITSSFVGMRFVVSPYVLRHPSQLYEAFLEGLLLFFVLQKVKKNKLVKGSIFALYIFGYGLARFVAEQFREPDSQIGFIGHLTLGQIFSLFMMIVGLILYFSLNNKKEFKKL